MRATLLHRADEAFGARAHGDANVLVLGADVTDGGAAEAILKIFPNTAALGERYGERRQRLATLDISKV